MTTKKRRRLSNMSFDEVSVVTNPANQHSKIVLWKSNNGPPDNGGRDLIAKRFEGLDVDSLDPDVAAAMHELLTDNANLAKGTQRERERQKALLAEIEEHDIGLALL